MLGIEFYNWEFINNFNCLSATMLGYGSNEAQSLTLPYVKKNFSKKFQKKILSASEKSGEIFFQNATFSTLTP